MRSLLHHFFRHHRHNLSVIGREHPLEVFWIAVYTLVLLIFPNETLAEYAFYYLSLLPCLVLLYTVRQRRVLYYAAGCLPVLACGLLYALDKDMNSTLASKLLCLNILALIALHVPFSLADNREFLSRALLTLVHIVSALLVSGCLLLTLGLLEGGFYMLFGIELHNWHNGKIYYVPLFALTPLMFLSFERLLQQKTDGVPLLLENRVIELSLNYIATPALMAYTLMIYVYTAKIILQGRLPQGGVSYIVGSYLAAGLFCHMLHTLSCQPKWARFYQIFPWLMLLPLIVLWTGVMERIGSYGLTEMRIWLLTAVILLSLFCLWSLRPQWRQYRRFAVLLLVAGLITGIVLPLKQIEYASQYARFDRMLTKVQLLDSQGRIVQPLPQPATGQEEHWQQLHDQATYFYYSEVEKAAADRYGAGLQQLLAYSREDPHHNPSESHQRLSLQKRLFSIRDGGTIEPVHEVSFNGDTGNIGSFDIRLSDYQTLRSIRVEQVQQHMWHIFERHRLNPQQQYSHAELAVLVPDILHIPLENGDILLAESLNLSYQPQKGYNISGIDAFVLFSPHIPHAASAPR